MHTWINRGSRVTAARHRGKYRVTPPLFSIILIKRADAGAGGDTRQLRLLLLFDNAVIKRERTFSDEIRRDARSVDAKRGVPDVV